MREFKNTYLCIKQHSVTGLIYLCRTQQLHADMLKYTGSGDYWKDHLKKHGKEHIITIWYCLFTEKEELEKFSLMCSDQWNVVKSLNESGKKIWANERPENGLDGAVKGIAQTDKHKEKRLLSIKKTCQLMSVDERAHKYGHPGEKNPMFGPCSEERAKNIGLANKGKLKGSTRPPFTEEHKFNMKLAKKINGTGGNGGANKGKTLSPRKICTCPHCDKVGTQGNMQRFHFDNCKFKEQTCS